MRIPFRSLLAALVIAAPVLFAQQVRADDAIRFDPTCKTSAPDTDPRAFVANCDVGPLAAQRVTRVTYRKEASDQPAAEATFLPFDLANRQEAVLFVVDRSDKRRARTIALAAGDTQRLADAAHGIGTYRFGLATMLGDRLDVSAPIGAPHDDFARAIAGVRADGFGADDSRAVSDAIRLIAQSPADRHVLVIASDGKPEDKSLGSADMILAARNAGVVVVGIGYREHSGDGPELPALKRLAEETGGFYVEPLLPATRLDDAAVARFGQFVGSGGLATFPLDRADPRGSYILTVEVEGGRPFMGTFVPDITIPGLHSAPVKPPLSAAAQLPQPTPKPALGPKPAANTPPALVAINPTPPPLPQRDPGSLQDMFSDVTASAYDLWSARPLTIIGGAALVLVLIVAGVGMAVRRARRIKIFAWIELLDQRHTRFAITTPGVRLGRHSDNDIRFRDKSVHRYHAVLQRDPATGAYSITDVSRTQARSNGVMVNGEFLYKPVALDNGDTVELGDVSFRFVYA